MNSYLILILGYLLIFTAIVLSYYRLKKIEITKEDLIYWRKLENIFTVFKNKILTSIKISEDEITYLWRNLVEKFLLRIKIFGLKIETWASKKLEKMKNKESF
ncbi:MAG: hypothetical protein KatS3mg096_264 [Candidatus Parcubacteria bacterium]|nr:MAG: hypothetical protein KatS3mg096_264 [Candidatus Parcubacteria bacterium]